MPAATCLTPVAHGEILENYELDKLKLVGTMLLQKERIGLIQTPEGGIYRVRIGSFIGPITALCVLSAKPKSNWKKLSKM